MGRVLWQWGLIQDLIGHAKCIWPEERFDGLRPSTFCEDELGSCQLLQVADPFFCDSILVVRIYPGEGKSLTVFCTVLDPRIGAKDAIVGVVVFDFNSTVSG